MTIKVQDSNPVYGTTNRGSQATEEKVWSSSGDHLDYDYMGNHDDYDYMEK